MNGTYRDRIEARIGELEAVPGFSVKRCDVAAPASQGLVDRVRSEAGGHLPAGAEEFYLQVNGFRLEWTYLASGSDGEATDEGSVNILPVEKVFSEWKDAVWFDSFEGGDRFRAVKPFDLYIPEACGAFFQPLGERPKNTVYFHYLGESLTELPLSFTDYVDQALNTCGYLGWHTALTSLDPESDPVLTRMRDIVPSFSDRLFIARP
ncbi:hypothetical protein [Streptomyces sp. WM6378]|uniref:hypothetical protein n=1 Tax=Streptomyces sp. WM6378 TaxID=1415557 RepID=UPI0006AF4464|nr:hypothetical protein [Streptomyces sp. WM6378]KOU36214.1 hypothetical protein ADK54_34820 [Streptomyces sp. WM6378]